jgi:hypothetical protein
MPHWLVEALQALAAWPVAAFLRSSTVAYATLNAAHIFSIGLIIGSIVALDLRILGVFARASLSELARPLSQVAAVGLIFAATSGFLLFSVRPLTYAANPAFLTKITLVAIGVLNALAVQFSPHWRAAREGLPPHQLLRAGALISLLVWAGAVLAGRWIGFLQ